MKQIVKPILDPESGRKFGLVERGDQADGISFPLASQKLTGWTLASRLGILLFCPLKRAPHWPSYP